MYKKICDKQFLKFPVHICSKVYATEDVEFLDHLLKIDSFISY